MSDNFLLELKSRLDIIDIVSEYLELHKTGSNYKARCPFHAEKTPSFVVSSEKQIFRCFGCGESGDAISFVSKIEGLDFKETIKKLSERVGMTVQVKSGTVNSSKYDEFYKITTLTKDFYIESLNKDKRAQKYLKDRSIGEALVKEFAVGYAPKEWDSLYKFLSQKQVSFAKTSELGLLTKKTKGYYDMYRDRIMFPIFNIYGQTLAFGGRIIDNDEKSPKYINSKASIVYDKSKNLYGLFQSKGDIRKQGRAIVVEGYLDLLSVYGAGIKNVVATLGTAFTKEQSKLLKRFTDTVILLFDGDSAGISAAKKSLGMLLAEGFKVFSVVLEAKADPDDVIKNKGVEYLKDKIKNAPELLSTVIQEAFKGAYSPGERGRALKSVIEYVVNISDNMTRMLWIEELSFKSKLSEEKILKYLSEHKTQIKKQTKQIRVHVETPNLKDIDYLYKHFVRILVNEPNLAIDIFDNEYDLYIPNELTNLAKIIKDSVSEENKENFIFFSNLVHNVPNWVSSIITEELMLQNRQDGRRFAREFDAVIRKFKIRFLENKKQDILEQIKEEESVELLNNYKELSKEINKLKTLR